MTDTATGRIGPRRVLVVEDDTDALANICDILELDNFLVDSASSAAEALNRPSHRWPLYEALILDRRLPDADFDSFMPQLRALAPDAELIIVTGMADLRGAIDALRGGASDYILKPLDPDSLRASLARALEHRDLRLAKRRSEAAFRTLVESAECVIVITRLNRSIVYFSSFGERLTGFQGEDLIGQDFRDRLIHEQDRFLADEALQRLKAGDSVRGIEGRLRCRDGSTRCLVWNARRLEDYEGSEAILVVGHDITELKQAQHRALQSERLAAIGQMVTGLAHESRNALQRGQSCLEMLALKVSDRPEAIDLIKPAASTCPRSGERPGRTLSPWSGSSQPSCPSPSKRLRPGAGSTRSASFRSFATSSKMPSPPARLPSRLKSDALDVSTRDGMRCRSRSAIMVRG